MALTPFRIIRLRSSWSPSLDPLPCGGRGSSEGALRSGPPGRIFQGCSPAASPSTFLAPPRWVEERTVLVWSLLIYYARAMGCNQVFDFSTADDSSRPSRLAGKRQLQPEVAPQVSHLEQEPLR